jgi:hypothetical protein
LKAKIQLIFLYKNGSIYLNKWVRSKIGISGWEKMFKNLKQRKIGGKRNNKK